MDKKHLKQGKEELTSPWWQEEKPERPLPDDLQQMLEQEDPAFVKAFLQAQRQVKNGAWLWTLYLDGRPLARQALYQALTEKQTVQVYYWKENRLTVPIQYGYTRYLKGIYKLAEKRRDAEIWGLLAYRFETDRSNTPDEYIRVKSKREDHYYWRWEKKEEKNTFQFPTRYYLRRRNWRFLRKLAEEKSEDFVRMATEYLLHIRHEDADWGQTRYIVINGNHVITADFSNLWLMNHLLFRHSGKFTCQGSKYRWRKTEAHTAYLSEEREEAYPDLWAQQPDALMRLFQNSEVNPVVGFALRALLYTSPEKLEAIPESTWHTFLQSDQSVRRNLAAQWLLNQMDHRQPDWDFVLELLLSPHVDIQEHVLKFIRRHMPHWTTGSIRELVDKLIHHAEENYALRRRLPGLLSPALAEIGNRKAGDLSLVQCLLHLPVDSLHQEAVDLLKKIDVHTITAEELLPYLSSETPMVREAACDILNRHFGELQIDASFLTDWVKIPLEENRYAAIQILAEKRFQLLPVLPEWLPILWASMKQSELSDEVRDFIRDDLLGNVFWEEIRSTPLDKVLLLFDSSDVGLQVFAGRLLEEIQPDPQDMTDQQLVRLAHSPAVAVRMWIRRKLEEHGSRWSADLMADVAETDWEDTRTWAMEQIQQLPAQQVTPDLVYRLLDSARPDIQQLAMVLSDKYRGKLDLLELMYRAGESPYLPVQLFALELGKAITWNAERVQKMERFFRTVLFRVHQGRPLKRIALDILAQWGLENEEMAQAVVPILRDYARSGGKGDFADVLVTLTRIQRQFPQIQTPVTIVTSSSVGS
ncbi:hypothetical protein GXN76_15625 [Kroppenstedtia pulmonis]|uniref:Uncharacterized protein n=1 Tax=Kroppenstedtia pulmonis TaxID=1380685 RepID=A0A7D3Y200_9BACL|nr:hypothetical protein [Kroppenstedtia pulmonis]QKG85740.1 hypothetical protein GXN76_15625 [Kroppenstedtia pulmonis]